MSNTIRRLLVLTAGTVLAAANISAGSALLIDFETFPDSSAVFAGTAITNQFTSWGVTFDSLPPSGATQVTNVIDALPTSSGNNFLAPGGPAPVNGGTLILDFSIPVIEVGSYFIDDQDEVAVTAFDANLDPVTTVHSDGISTGFDSWSISHASGITRVELVGGYITPSAPDGWGIDDLAYTQIPEPTTLLLLILGGLGAAKRKIRTCHETSGGIDVS